MKNCICTILEEIGMWRFSPRIVSVLVIAATLMIGNQSIAGEFRFLVLLENVPGTSEIEDGKIQTGIKMLENQLNQVEQRDSGDIWSTLCATYIVTASLNQAETACNKAVEISPTYHALNNRGVFRVHIGDLSKAREDFERVRPSDVEAYLDRLKTKDARLVAASNLDLIIKLSAERAHRAEIAASNVVRPAEIEDLSD